MQLDLVRRGFVPLLALAVLGGLLAACEPTGHADCDAYLGPQLVIEEHGYRLDCAPEFPNVAGSGPRAGQTIFGWTDHNRETVWVWAGEFDGPRRLDKLKKVLWHEAAHVVGVHDEWLADVYAWCHMGSVERNGLFFRSPMPTEADCQRVP